MYFHNRFIFVRPAISTEHIDADPPSYRSYYPLQQGLRDALIDIVLDMGFERRFADFGRDLRNVLRGVPRAASRGRSGSRRITRSRCCPRRSSATRPRTSSGASINGIHTYPFVVPVKHDADGKLRLDALLMDDGRPRDPVFGESRVLPRRHGGAVRLRRASCARSLPDKTAAELYTMVGLQKGGKNLFYRDFLHHLKHSRDKFIIAPGIKGLVMSGVHAAVVSVRVQGDPDNIAASKDTDRQKVKQKYTLVKHHDRVGRMTDIARVFRRRVSARALLRRAGRGAHRASRPRWSSSTATT